MIGTTGGFTISTISNFGSETMTGSGSSTSSTKSSSSACSTFKLSRSMAVGSASPS